MSIQAITWALDFSDLPPDRRTGRMAAPAKLILILLASYASPEGTDAFPSVRSLADSTGLSERAVQYTLDALVEHGTIRRTPHPLHRDETIARGDRRPTSYDLLAMQRGAKSRRHGVQSRPPRGAKSTGSGVQSRGEAIEGLTPVEPKPEPSSSEVAAATPDPPLRPDVDQLCHLLHQLITANGSKAAIGQKWRDDARLLLDRDNRPLAEALDLIRWCQADPFWRTNILSMPTFRKQYDKLRLQYQTNGHSLSNGHVPYRNPAQDEYLESPR